VENYYAWAKVFVQPSLQETMGVAAMEAMAHGILGQAVQSALDQTFKDIEVIVVDDGSTDNTKEVLERFKGKIHYIYQPNRGVSAARNKGLMAAKGEYIALLDADDVWLPEKLELQVELLERRPEISVVYAWSYYIDEDNRILPQMSRPQVEGNPLKDLLVTCIFPPLTFVIRRECFEKVGLFDEDLHTGEDWNLFVRMCIHGYKFAYIPEPLAMYRVRNSGALANTGKVVANDLKCLNKIYSDERIPEELKSSLKAKALFNIYAEHCWQFYLSGNREKGRELLLKAIQVYPQAFGNIQTFFSFASWILPRGYRTNQQIYKRVDTIKNTLFYSFNDLFSNHKGISNLKNLAYSNLNAGLGMMFYFARRMTEARFHFMEVYQLNPLLGLKPVIVYTFLKSFLGSRAITYLSQWKRGIFNYNTY